MNTRRFIRKKPAFQVESRSLEETLRTDLGLRDDFHLDQYVIYDIFNADDDDLALLEGQVIAEPAIDEVLDHVDTEGKYTLAMEYLPGQYDQRADSAMQCLMLLNSRQDVRIHSGTLLVMENLDDKQAEEIEAYMINPVEARRKNMDVLDDSQSIDIQDVPTVEGFTKMSEEELEGLRESLGLAMSLEDLVFVQSYFKEEEKRDPSLTEIRVLDTYWSDHCRHTTFETILQSVDFKNDTFGKQIEDAWNQYLDLRAETGREEKPITLMDLATIAGRTLRKRGKLDDQEVSDEINACSIEIEVDVNGTKQPWLLMFKNETHNHPTEIEPFGGASTCIGGAIRDPLSGRSYVYQAVRITGAGDVTAPLADTLEHKLPQSKISKTAAKGYSSYGNQIGLATTYVEELFDPGYTAKRMEVGGVIGAAPKNHVKREKPQPGDVIIYIGGATGRDGIGGATGSSKEHNDQSLDTCSSEVQKGNALMERKLQRLFSNPDATRLIKKANDFGAGGVSVAVGELADGLDIDLDAVPVKYAGLDGTELAISESQERMAVCIAAEDKEAFLKECEKENLNAVQVATVTDTNRLVMKWRGDTIVDLDRSFLDTNGVRQKVDVTILEGESECNPFVSSEKTLDEALAEDNTANQRGLSEMFDASIGKSTVLMPFGGKTQHTPEIGSVQKLPVRGFTTTCSAMTYGFDPKLSRFSPWLGAQYSVVEALARLSALGFDPLTARLSNQEYFERLGFDPDKWGYPLQALLGLVKAEMEFETPAIGGKDSMSGTFNDIHVPPTLITFATAVTDTDHVISSAFKEPGHLIYLVRHIPEKDGSPNYEQLKHNFASIQEENENGHIAAARIVKDGGVGAALAIMAFGNEIGVNASVDDPFGFGIGSIVVETTEDIDRDNWILLGHTTKAQDITLNEKTESLAQAYAAWSERYARLYPTEAPARTEKDAQKAKDVSTYSSEKRYSKVKYDKPLVVIPVFPGQNCEFDTAEKFRRAGAEVQTIVFNNLDVDHINESIDMLAKAIEKAQIFMIVGGFSLADEPDGSGKFIVSVLKNEKIKNALDTMRASEGLILGICNGFQALVKSGLLPFGDLNKNGEELATLFRNDINRHVSRVARTRITSNNSPWLQDFDAGDTFSIVLSHGEGKFMADPELLQEMIDNHQIATQYVDENGEPSMNVEDNLNGSMLAIEGVLSKDGMIFGKMGHSERYEPGLFQNISGNRDQDIFASGVRFFTHKEKD